MSQQSDDNDAIVEAGNETAILRQRPPTKSGPEIALAETEIVENIKDVRYIVREYPAEIVVRKYLVGKDQDQNEIYVPDYQRDLIWPVKNQSRFIESVLIGIPIPFLFVADISEKEDPDSAGRLEIVDGVQRIRTLVEFMSGQLVLNDLERLKSLNGFTFFDLHPSRQRRFRRATLRLIELTEMVTEDVRRDMFDRINSGSVGLEAVEVRRGVEGGPFVDLTTELAKNPTLHKLAPISETMKKRFEYEELITRFFAFSDRYEQFGTGPEGKVVKDFLLKYVRDRNTELKNDQSGVIANKMRQEWNDMLAFVASKFPNGFVKTGRGRKVPRVRFEAISVGTNLALRSGKPIDEADIPAWLDGKLFQAWTTSDSSNNRANLIGRIDYVKNKLIGE
ncbi:DUF262 domain-containing protein [Bradyrhizobium elkanii]|jgi:hypothetical protein|uniref:DUF262 domain-containing protein n=1 Tax=Bradyrhizobium elkanii TaxID=29448 RepID=UPI001449C7D9|nr:DUF262 domain-containing protein [Bradyrhizobium elkanii]MCP1927710.1 hypothetical protein [Bradyrhizobium elkanii]MCS3581681.1 hypothetical protein [Bradyrhizobium elkanii]MCS3724555.1 hypothetical protein [Bradyrhizobium elkanii]MCS4008967.1 hypothetical protein [Bradyrhizobium elkanii USDA 61]WLA40777.1 DUF262 domain-containing protein [Bradyrhizobium elkanii]